MAAIMFFFKLDKEYPDILAELKSRKSPDGTEATTLVAEGPAV
jgi:hypothetical protein